MHFFEMLTRCVNCLKSRKLVCKFLSKESWNAIAHLQSLWFNNVNISYNGQEARSKQLYNTNVWQADEGRNDGADRRESYLCRLLFILQVL